MIIFEILSDWQEVPIEERHDSFGPQGVGDEALEQLVLYGLKALQILRVTDDLQLVFVVPHDPVARILVWMSLMLDIGATSSTWQQMTN